MKRKFLMTLICGALMLSVTGCENEIEKFGNDVSKYLESRNYVCRQALEEKEMLNGDKTIACFKSENGLTYNYEISSSKDTDKHIALMVKEDDVYIKIWNISTGAIVLGIKDKFTTKYEAVSNEDVFNGDGVQLSWECRDSDLKNNKLYKEKCELQNAYLSITNKAVSEYRLLLEKFNADSYQ